MNKDILIIIGPTAIGKSAFAIETARKKKAEIISADAFQVYKYMDIGTAKISEEEQKIVKHHLIDIKTPDEPYSVKEFIERTNEIISNLRKNNTPVIICGGTGFYINAFLYGYEFNDMTSKDLDIRARLTDESKKIGSTKFWQKLHSIDPKAANLIDQKNTRRVVRALEIFYTTDRLPSEFRKKTTQPRADVEIVGLINDRAIFYDRINKRVDKMIELGLIDEVRDLLKKGYEDNTQAFEALGYKEVIMYLKGSINKEEMIELVKTKTRQFAKRQMTWFNRFENVKWINVS
jgi:tRNA dimethylallyltransferase